MYQSVNIFFFIYICVCVCVYVYKHICVFFIYIYSWSIYLYQCPVLVPSQARGKAAARNLPPSSPPRGGKAANSHRKAPSSQGRAAAAGSRCLCCSGGWWHGVLEPQPPLVGTPEHRAELSPPCWGRMPELSVPGDRGACGRATAGSFMPWAGSRRALLRGWTRKQEVMPAKRLCCIATQMPPESPRDADEVADGRCEMISVALRRVPACGAIRSAQLLGALGQLDAGCVRMSPTRLGDIPVPPAWPSLEMSVPGKATRGHYIHVFPMCSMHPCEATSCSVG